MAAATSAKSSSGGRPSSGGGTAAKTSAVKRGRAAKGAATTASAKKEDLRSRVEKLERANVTLRTKNKELRIVAVAAAEQVDALTLALAKSERSADRQTQREAPAKALETRDLARPSRGKRKALEVAAEGNSNGSQDLGAEMSAD
jgi:hypothetical protein